MEIAAATTRGSDSSAPEDQRQLESPPPPPPVRSEFHRRSRWTVLAISGFALLVCGVVLTLPAPASPALEAPPPTLRTTSARVEPSLTSPASVMPENFSPPLPSASTAQPAKLVGKSAKARTLPPITGALPPAPEPQVAASSRTTGITCRGAMQARAWDDAVTLCTKEARAGRASAERSLGELFEDGHGVARSDADAAKWYLKAGESGDRDAMYRVAVAYEKGRGVRKDGAAALVWYMRAAEAGLADAQFSVGQAFEKGKLGAPKNKATALQWYRRAAGQGDKAAAAKVKEMER